MSKTQARSDLEKRDCIPCVTYCCKQAGCNGYLHCGASFVSSTFPEVHSDGLGWGGNFADGVLSAPVTNTITATANVDASMAELRQAGQREDDVNSELILKIAEYEQLP